jgi:hypothetical protein
LHFLNGKYSLQLSGPYVLAKYATSSKCTLFEVQTNVVDMSTTEIAFFPCPGCPQISVSAISSTASIGGVSSFFADGQNIYFPGGFMSRSGSLFTIQFDLGVVASATQCGSAFCRVDMASAVVSYLVDGILGNANGYSADDFKPDSVQLSTWSPSNFGVVVHAVSSLTLPASRGQWISTSDGDLPPPPFVQEPKDAETACDRYPDVRDAILVNCAGARSMARWVLEALCADVYRLGSYDICRFVNATINVNVLQPVLQPSAPVAPPQLPSCSAGSVRDGNGPCAPCFPGSFAVSGDLSCKPCGTGFTSPAGASSCTVVVSSTPACSVASSGAFVVASDVTRCAVNVSSYVSATNTINIAVPSTYCSVSKLACVFNSRIVSEISPVSCTSGSVRCRVPDILPSGNYSLSLLINLGTLRHVSSQVAIAQPRSLNGTYNFVAYLDFFYQVLPYSMSSELQVIFSRGVSTVNVTTLPRGLTPFKFALSLTEFAEPEECGRGWLPALITSRFNSSDVANTRARFCRSVTGTAPILACEARRIALYTIARAAAFYREYVVSITPSRIGRTSDVTSLPRAQSGRAWGDVHYVSYDGASFDMQIPGQFVLTKLANTDQCTLFEAQVDNRYSLDGRWRGATLTKSVAFMPCPFCSHVVMSVDANETIQLTVDGLVSVDDSLVFAGGNFVARANRTTISLNFNIGVSVTASVCGKKTSSQRFCNVVVHSAIKSDLVDGLLGNMNGYVTDDKKTRNVFQHWMVPQDHFGTRCRAASVFGSGISSSQRVLTDGSPLVYEADTAADLPHVCQDDVPSHVNLVTQFAFACPRNRTSSFQSWLSSCFDYVMTNGTLNSCEFAVPFPLDSSVSTAASDIVREYTSFVSGISNSGPSAGPMKTVPSVQMDSNSSLTLTNVSFTQTQIVTFNSTLQTSSCVFRSSIGLEPGSQLVLDNSTVSGDVVTMGTVEIQFTASSISGSLVLRPSLADVTTERTRLTLGSSSGRVALASPVLVLSGTSLVLPAALTLQADVVISAGGSIVTSGAGITFAGNVRTVDGVILIPAGTVVLTQTALVISSTTISFNATSLGKATALLRLPTGVSTFGMNITISNLPSSAENIVSSTAQSKSIFVSMGFRFSSQPTQVVTVLQVAASVVSACGGMRNADCSSSVPGPLGFFCDIASGKWVSSLSALVTAPFDLVGELAVSSGSNLFLDNGSGVSAQVASISVTTGGNLISVSGAPALSVSGTVDFSSSSSLLTTYTWGKEHNFNRRAGGQGVLSATTVSGLSMASTGVFVPPSSCFSLTSSFQVQASTQGSSVQFAFDGLIDTSSCYSSNASTTLPAVISSNELVSYSNKGPITASQSSPSVRVAADSVLVLQGSSSLQSKVIMSEYSTLALKSSDPASKPKVDAVELTPNSILTVDGAAQIQTSFVAAANSTVTLQNVNPASFSNPSIATPAISVQGSCVSMDSLAMFILNLTAPFSTTGTEIPIAQQFGTGCPAITRPVLSVVSPGSSSVPAECGADGRGQTKPVVDETGTRLSALFQFTKSDGSACSKSGIDESASGTGLSGGAIAGIIIAVIVIVALFAAGLIFWRRRDISNASKRLTQRVKSQYGATGDGVVGAGAPIPLPVLASADAPESNDSEDSSDPSEEAEASGDAQEAQDNDEPSESAAESEASGSGDNQEDDASDASSDEGSDDDSDEGSDAASDEDDSD